MSKFAFMNLLSLINKSDETGYIAFRRGGSYILLESSSIIFESHEWFRGVARKEISVKTAIKLGLLL
jgi:hypothetical protein